MKCPKSLLIYLSYQICLQNTILKTKCALNVTNNKFLQDTSNIAKIKNTKEKDQKHH